MDLAYGGNGKPGWVRAGDMDGDLDMDLVAGGGLALFVYENDGTASGWTRHGSLDPTGQMGANGAVLLDVDRDGDLDIVCAKAQGALGWWENPPGPLSAGAWPFHPLHPGFAGWFAHDVLLADLDGDGAAREVVFNLNQGYWDAPVRLLWLRPGPHPAQAWQAFPIDGPRAGLNHCHAGLSAGDVDGDGRLDLGYSDGWYEAPDDPTTGAWIWHRVVSDVYGISNNVLEDLDEDGDLDLLVSGGHHGQGVYWYEAPNDVFASRWIRHVIDPDVIHPEGLLAADLDRDGDLDLVSTELHFGEAAGEPAWSDEAHQVYAYRNVAPGGPPRWSRQNLSPDSFPSHLPQLADVNRDGRLDIVAEGAGFSSVTYFESRLGNCPDVVVSQPGGAGGAILLHGTGLTPGAPAYHLFSFPSAAAPLGTGPYLGLSAPDPSHLVAQFLQPLGTTPFHFLAPDTREVSFGPYPVIPMVIDVVSFHFSPLTGLGEVSPVSRYAIE